MQPKVIITCAVTGAGDTVGKHPAIPVTPEQIANSALEAASAGATVVHCHVREPSTGKGSRKVEYYAEVMERIRAKNKEVIINLTAGMGGDVEVGSGAKPLDFGPGTYCVGPEDNLWLERGVHASNGTLVEKAVKIIQLLGTNVASPDEGREILKLKPRT